MIALLQRVREARVEVAGQVIGQIDAGFLMLVCAEPTDTEEIAEKLIAKVLKLRVFIANIFRESRRCGYGERDNHNH